MKKIITIALLCGLAFKGISQNTNWSTSSQIGVGTTTPDGNFHVNGISLLAGGNSNLDNRYNTVPLNFLANSGQVLFGWNRTGGAGEIDFLANQGGGNTGGFAFYNHNNSNVETQLMWLTGNGRLLLGVSDPNTGSNKLAVGGGIIAESVTIKLQGHWPDYVFKPTYNLKPLWQVKQYIDLNHHLPGVPNEEEILKDGVNVVEMNKVLLKKIEELTLYMIELQKQIDQLKKK